MLGFGSLSLVALLLSPAVLGDSHLRNKRRQHESRNLTSVEQFEGRATNEGHALAKRAFTGRGTFYYTGLGACGIYNKDSDYIVALNSAQYHLHGTGYPGPECWKTLTIQANGQTVGGVQVTDECPTCDWGSLDLSPGLFTRFAPESAGVLDITWWWDDGSSQQTSTQQPQTSTTPAWSPDPAPTSTSTWSPSPTPTSTYTPPPTTTSTSTWVAPSSSSTSTSTTVFSSASSAAASSSFSASASASNSTNPFAIVSHDNSTSATISIDPSASASASASVTSSTVTEGTIPTNAGNLVAINGLVASYGQLIVIGAGGHSG